MGNRNGIRGSEAAKADHYLTKLNEFCVVSGVTIRSAPLLKVSFFPPTENSPKTNAMKAAINLS